MGPAEKSRTHGRDPNERVAFLFQPPGTWFFRRANRPVIHRQGLPTRLYRTASFLAETQQTNVSVCLKCFNEP